MAHRIDTYVDFKLAVERWLQGHGEIASIADTLNITSTSLTEMLSWFGLASITGIPYDNIQPQDVMNAIFMAYCKRPPRRTPKR